MIPLTINMQGTHGRLHPLWLTHAHHLCAAHGYHGGFQCDNCLRIKGQTRKNRFSAKRE